MDGDAPAPTRIDAGQLHSVLSALDALECFSEAEELGVTEIARQLGVAKSTAHRLLTTLAARDMVARDQATGRYRLGLHLYELGQLYQARQPMRRAALGVLEELHLRTGQTVHLATADRADVIFVERIIATDSIDLLADRRRRVPLHLTSVGKAIAAFDPIVASARADAGFPAATPRTITSEVEWWHVLADVRRRGYAVSDSESREGLASIAAPVRLLGGAVQYAVSVAGPRDRVLGHRDNLVHHVQDAAARIGRTARLA